MSSSEDDYDISQEDADFLSSAGGAFLDELSLP
jgi:hypothetical protein